MSSPLTVPSPTLRVLPTGPPELTVVLHEEPAVVPPAFALPLPRTSPEVEHRMSLPEARAALDRLGREGHEDVEL